MEDFKFSFEQESKEYIENNYLKSIMFKDLSNGGPPRVNALIETLESTIIEADWSVTRGGLKILKINHLIPESAAMRE